MTDRQTHPLADRLTEGVFYASNPHATYEILRAEAPVAWSPQGGHWVATSHAAVLHASTRPDLFCSRRGILTMEIGVDYSSPPTMMHTDPPEHTAYRKLVAPGFRPSVIRSLASRVQERTDAALDAISDEPIDFVDAVAVPLPLLLIADVLGVPIEDLDRFFEWSEAAIPGNTEVSAAEQSRLMGECWAYLLEVCRVRRATPADDIVSILAHTELDGRRLRDDELVMFLNQLLIAGNETTRNALSGAVDAFARHPDQYRRLRDDRSLMPAAVEEILRWTTPVISFLRTATEDAMLDGVEVRAGDPVLLVYQAANRDPRAFGATVDQFDVGRDPNPHLSFGFGAHFCIGAALARLELSTVLAGMLDRWSGVQTAGAVQRTSSVVISGIRSLPVRFET